MNQVNNAHAGAGADSDGRTSNGLGGNRPETPPLVMKMKLKQSKKCNSMGSGAMSPLELQACTSPPQTFTAENSPERQPRPHHLLKRQFSTTQQSYLKSLPYHRSVYITHSNYIHCYHKKKILYVQHVGVRIRNQWSPLSSSKNTVTTISTCFGYGLIVAKNLKNKMLEILIHDAIF